MNYKFISHRGNINGPEKEKENTLKQIDLAIEYGYDVEIDIRYIDNNFYLGHDEPSNLIDKRFLFDRSLYLWIHCKNIESLFELNEYKIFNIFSHDQDDAVLTSNRKLWTYPGKKLTKQSICVLPEITNYTIEEMKNCSGICSDFIEKYKNMLTS